jgi:hypothetical protein
MKKLVRDDEVLKSFVLVSKVCGKGDRSGT